MKVLITGATGYVGGRLAPRLIEEGHEVRAMTRSASRLRDVPWAGRAEIAEADMLDSDRLAAALEGVEVAYYLVHSIPTGKGFTETDRRAAGAFSRCARAAGVRRVVYLGGMAGDRADASQHLSSRAEVGTILLDSGVPTIVLQAAVIVGTGSASFEMLRYLTERLPVMVTPRWVRTRVQPIAIRDVLRYLAGAATMPLEVSGRFDIAGPDVLTYGDMMQRYAAVAGLRRRVIVPVPVLSPALSSLWINVVTPVPGAIAKPLVRSLVTEVVARDQEIARWIPDPPDGLLGFDDSVQLALRTIRDDESERRSPSDRAWAPSDPFPTDPPWSGGSLYRDVREATVAVTPDRLWSTLVGIGGERGWYSYPSLWKVRGLLDRLVGGVGLRPGRRDAETLNVNDALDFWRVEKVDPGRLLRLRAEMRLPGLAWLEWRLEPVAGGRTRFMQRALYAPRGLIGHTYWWAVAPFHALVFGTMMRNIADAAVRTAATAPTRPAADRPDDASTVTGDPGSAGLRQTAGMSAPEDPAKRLTRSAASEAVESIGWRYLLGTLQTSVPVSSLDQGVRVAAAAARACGAAADGHLRADLRPDRVELSLQTRALAAVTDRDTALAHTISTALSTLGTTTTGPAQRPVQTLELAIDTLDVAKIRPFWKAVLALADEPDTAGPADWLIDPAGQLPTIWFQQMDTPRPQRNRIHLDITVAHDEAEARVRDALAAGGTLVDDSHARSFWVLADAEGNEVCVCSWLDRDQRDTS